MHDQHQTEMPTFKVRLVCWHCGEGRDVLTHGPAFCGKLRISGFLLKMVFFCRKNLNTLVRQWRLLILAQ